MPTTLDVIAWSPVKRAAAIEAASPAPAGESSSSATTRDPPKPKATGSTPPGLAELQRQNLKGAARTHASKASR
jgi:hypothetical protein